MEVELLSRIQFAVTAGFHFLYPPISIGLGMVLVFIKYMHLKTKDDKWDILAKFWTKIFALVFGVGVVTGIVMEFEFGTAKFDSLFKASKYANYPDFEKRRAGHIVITNHSDESWYRNIKIRRL